MEEPCPDGDGTNLLSRKNFRCLPEGRATGNCSKMGLNGPAIEQWEGPAGGAAQSGWKRVPVPAIATSDGAGVKRGPNSAASASRVWTTEVAPRLSMIRSGPPR